MPRKTLHIIPLNFSAVLLCCFLAAFSLMGCKKMVEVDSPSNALTSDNVYTNDATAAAVLSGIYSTLANFSPVRGITFNSISLVSGLASDELDLYGGSANANAILVQFYQNKLNPGLSTSAGVSLWSDIYSKLYVVNLALERLRNSTSLTPAVKDQLMGEGVFLRGLFYMYLVNLYGDVPLSTSSDYRVTSALSRTPKDQVFQQVITDLKEAQNLLGDNYVSVNAKTITTERLRPNKWAATALLARAYLYTGQWTEAETLATAIINNKSKYDTVSLDNVFLKNSKEAIWQLQPVNLGWNTEDARVFILPVTGPTGNSSVEGYPVYLSNQLVSIFESNDQRKTAWVKNIMVGTGATSATYSYPYKYRSAELNAPVTEYLMILRLAEQFLIRAEARTQLNKISEAKSDLNVIRQRASLANTSTNDKATLLNEILKERRVEFFTEWGHRWIDLKRTGNIDMVMNLVAPNKGTTWNSNWQWWPIPLYDINQNPNLKQNPGY
jgi:hypothetical protein